MRSRSAPTTISVMTPPLPNAKDSSGKAAGGESLSSRLPRSMRGYDRGSTDKLLADLEARRSESEREAIGLRERVAGLDAELDHHRQQEQLVSKTLLAATSQAAAIREEARQEAELMLRKVQAQLGERAALGERLERERAEAERELLRLRQLAQEMQQGLERFLTETLEQLRPEADTAVDEKLPAADEEGALVHALDLALKQETGQRYPSAGEVAPPQPSALNARS